MSRLIDADGIGEEFREYRFDGGKYSGCSIGDLIDSQDTVDAIPTEWIRDQMCEYLGMESAMWSKLLRIWKREAKK